MTETMIRTLCAGAAVVLVGMSRPGPHRGPPPGETPRLDASGTFRRSVGFQHTTIPGKAGESIEIGVWYPSEAPSSAVALGMFTQQVATDGAINGSHRPLVLISHGTGGSLASHYDTALELARAGFVVVALTHPGDNTRDQSAAGNYRDLLDRPRHLGRVLAYMTGEWPERGHLDTTRIGIIGVSLGAYAALVAAGGKPALQDIHDHCTRTPTAPECAFVIAHHGDQMTLPAPVQRALQLHPRIRALVLVAPALGFLFARPALRNVNIPVQIWRAGNDQQAPNPTNSDLIASALPIRPDVHTVPRAGHLVFVAPCSSGLAQAAPALCTDPIGVDRDSVHARFNRAITRFLMGRLPGPATASRDMKTPA